MSARWKPLVGDKYWTMGDVTARAIYTEIWTEDDENGLGRGYLAYRKGNLFKTKAEVEAAAEKINDLLLCLHEQIQL